MPESSNQVEVLRQRYRDIEQRISDLLASMRSRQNAVNLRLRKLEDDVEAATKRADDLLRKQKNREVVTETEVEEAKLESKRLKQETKSIQTESRAIEKLLEVDVPALQTELQQAARAYDEARAAEIRAKIKRVQDILKDALERTYDSWLDVFQDVPNGSREKKKWTDAAPLLRDLYQCLHRTPANQQQASDVLSILKKLSSTHDISPESISVDFVHEKTCISLREHYSFLQCDVGRICSVWRFVVDKNLTTVMAALQDEMPDIDTGVPAWAQCLAAGEKDMVARLMKLGANLRCGSRTLLDWQKPKEEARFELQPPCMALRQAFASQFLFSFPSPAEDAKTVAEKQRRFMEAMMFLQDQHRIEIPKYKLPGTDTTSTKQPTQLSWLFDGMTGWAFSTILEFLPEPYPSQLIRNLRKIVDAYRLNINEAGVTKDGKTIGELLHDSPVHLIEFFKLGVNVPSASFGNESTQAIVDDSQNIHHGQVSERLSLLIKEAQNFLQERTRAANKLAATDAPPARKLAAKSVPMKSHSMKFLGEMLNDAAKQAGPAGSSKTTVVSKDATGPATKFRAVERNNAKLKVVASSSNGGTAESIRVGSGSSSSSSARPRPTSSASATTNNASLQPGRGGGSNKRPAHTASSSSSSSSNRLLLPAAEDETAGRLTHGTIAEQETDSRTLLLRELSVTGKSMKQRIASLRKTDKRFEKLTVKQITDGIRRQLDRVWKFTEKQGDSPLQNGKLGLQLVFDYVSAKFSRDDAVSTVFGALLQANNEYGAGLQTCSPLRMVLYVLDGRVDLGDKALPGRTSVRALFKKLSQLHAQKPATLIEYGQKCLRQLKPKRDEDLRTVFDLVVSGEAPMYAKNRLRGLFAEKVLSGNGKEVKDCLAHAAANNNLLVLPLVGHMSQAMRNLLRNVWEIAELLTNAFLSGDHMQNAFSPFLLEEVNDAPLVSSPSHKRNAGQSLTKVAARDRKRALDKDSSSTTSHAKRIKGAKMLSNSDPQCPAPAAPPRKDSGSASHISEQQPANPPEPVVYRQHRSDRCDKPRLATFMTTTMLEAVGWSGNDKTAKHKLKKLSLKDLQKIYSAIPQRDADSCDTRLRDQGYENVVDFSLHAKTDLIEYLLRIYVLQP
ncbi:unnamed protein product [Amoebophrya sp. A120]|nr:unnamed protein product [Amoebophrya sp. A120]|eukprot:GSA120T00005581001.1